MLHRIILTTPIKTGRVHVHKFPLPINQVLNRLTHRSRVVHVENVERKAAMRRNPEESASYSNLMRMINYGRATFMGPPGKKQEKVRWGRLLVVGTGVIILLAFGPEMKSGFSRQTAEVATQSLRDEALLLQTQELAAQIVRTVLNDPNVLHQASNFLNKLLTKEMTQQALVDLTKHALNDPAAQSAVTKLSKKLLSELMQDPGTLDQLLGLLKTLILDQSTRDSAIHLAQAIMRDEDTREQLNHLLSWAFKQELVKQSVARTLEDSVHTVLSNDDVNKHAKVFVGEVVGDKTVQTASGDALWGTVWYTLTPRWISWLWRGSAKDPDNAPTQGIAADSSAVPSQAGGDQEIHIPEEQTVATVDVDEPKFSKRPWAAENHAKLAI